MGVPVTLTAYQRKCLLLTSHRGKYLMLAHQQGFRKLTECGFIYPDHVGCGAVWIAPSPAGLAYLRQTAPKILETT